MRSVQPLTSLRQVRHAYALICFGSFGTEAGVRNALSSLIVAVS